MAQETTWTCDRCEKELQRWGQLGPWRARLDLSPDPMTSYTQGATIFHPDSIEDTDLCPACYKACFSFLRKWLDMED